MTRKHKTIDAMKFISTHYVHYISTQKVSVHYISTQKVSVQYISTEKVSLHYISTQKNSVHDIAPQKDPVHDITTHYITAGLQNLIPLFLNIRNFNYKDSFTFPPLLYPKPWV